MRADPTPEQGRPIVVGVDDSPAGLRALSWALDEALLRGCVVHAVTVWAVDGAHDFVVTSAEHARRAQEQFLLNRVRQACTGRAAVPPIVPKLVEGPPAAALIAAAREAALLVVATHRGERVRKVLFGSVSSACALHATVPVVVVPPETRAENPEAVAERADAPVPHVPQVAVAD